LIDFPQCAQYVFYMLKDSKEDLECNVARLKKAETVMLAFYDQTLNWQLAIVVVRLRNWARLKRCSHCARHRDVVRCRPV